jgi:hypothetical protein
MIGCHVCITNYTGTDISRLKGTVSTIYKLQDATNKELKLINNQVKQNLGAVLKFNSTLLKGMFPYRTIELVPETYHTTQQGQRKLLQYLCMGRSSFRMVKQHLVPHHLPNHLFPQTFIYVEINWDLGRRIASWIKQP